MHQFIFFPSLVFWRLFSRDATGYNCGKEASEWLNVFLKTTGLKLVCFVNDLPTNPVVSRIPFTWILFSKSFQTSVVMSAMSFGFYTYINLRVLVPIHSRIPQLFSNIIMEIFGTISWLIFRRLCVWFFFSQSRCDSGEISKKTPWKLENVVFTIYKNNK